MGDICPRTRVVLLPSHAETFSLIGVDAQAARCAVTASDLPAVREPLDDDAFFAAPNAMDAWAVALEQLDDPDVRVALIDPSRANSLDKRGKSIGARPFT